MVLLCCVLFVCCLFVRKTNGRDKRFYARELPLSTSGCCLFDGDVATDVFSSLIRFYMVFYISSDVIFVSMVIYRKSVRETLSSGL